MNSFHYDSILNSIFEKTTNRLMSEVDDNKLIEILKSKQIRTGKIIECNQRTIAEFFPLIANHKWEVVYSYYMCDDCYKSHSQAPIFCNTESFLKWEELRKDKERFEKEWRDFDKKHGDFWEDSRFFDGDADITFGSIDFLNITYVKEQEKYIKRKFKKIDEIAITIYKKENEYDSFGYDKITRRKPKAVFVLSPCEKDEDSRLKIISKMFKHTIISDYARFLMKKQDELYIDKITDDIIKLNNKNIFK